MSQKFLVPILLPADPANPLEAATKQYVDANSGFTKAVADPLYVDVAGDTMTGLLTLSANPTANLHAATKQYVDGLVRRCGCLLTHSASIGTGVTSTIAWATEAEDTDGFHAANATDIVIPAGLGGYYGITIQTDAGGTLNGPSNVQITVGSVTYPNYIPASNRYGALSITVSCAAATVIRGIVYNGHSGAATFASRFSVQRVSL